jgi:large subunit ribosomal protein L34
VPTVKKKRDFHLGLFITFKKTPVVPVPMVIQFLRAVIGGPLNRVFKRFTTYGTEYQPSTRRRKRKHGFLRLLKNRNGRNIIKLGMATGRRDMSH